MLVCHCRAVCDRVIRQCVRAGTTSLEEIGDACGAGTKCGGCHDAILDIIDDVAAEPAHLVTEVPPPAAHSPGLRRLPVITSDDLSEVA